MICTSLAATLDFIGYVVLCAPDEFPTEDNLDLETAFVEMREGLAQFEQAGANHLVTGEAGDMLEKALGYYRSGLEREGAWTLQEMQSMLRSKGRAKRP